MAYLFSVFWFWLLLALGVGLFIGAGACRFRGDLGWQSVKPWLLWISLGVLVAVLKLLPERIGYWFDLAMLMVVAYFIGCCIACLWRRHHEKVLAIAAPGLVSASKQTPVVTPVAAMATPGVEKAPMPERAVEPMTVAVIPLATPSEEAITGLSTPRGTKDDLTQVYGIDAGTENRLNALGIYHYDQLATLNPGQRRWLFRQLGYEGRFPSWWWRWRYDAEKLAGEASKASASAPAPVPSDTGGASAEGNFEGTRPATLAAPREGKADDLKRIKGIGKQNEGRLHGLGVWHFDQIAAWTADEIKWVGGYLAFVGRIEREDWVGQAKILAKGGETDFSKRADSGLVATSRDDGGDDGRNNVAVPGKDFSAKPGKGKGQ